MVDEIIMVNNNDSGENGEWVYHHKNHDYHMFNTIVDHQYISIQLLLYNYI